MTLELLAATPLDGWTDYLERAGVLGVLLLAVLAFYTGRIVPGSVYQRDLEAERRRTDEFKNLATTTLDRIERGMGAAAATAVTIAKER